jgi:hypothetical protein
MAQKEKMLDFMDFNPDFAAGRLLGPLGRRKSVNLWEKLATILNSEGTGASKTAEKWKGVCILLE